MTQRVIQVYLLFYNSLKENILFKKKKLKMKPMCVICTDIFSVDSTISVIHCGHPFHEHCLNNWLRDGQNNTCPQCRHIATPQTVIKKLFFTESGEDENGDEIDKGTAVNEVSNHNDRLMNEIEILKQIIKENDEQIQNQVTSLEKASIIFLINLCRKLFF